MKVRAKLFVGFAIIAAIGVFLGIMGLYIDRRLTNESDDMRIISETRSTITTILSAHYNWRHGLSETVHDGAAFTGSLDSKACGLGKWLSGDEVKNVTDPEVLALLKDIVDPHDFIHTEARDIINDLNIGEKDNAIKDFKDEVLPRTLMVISDLEKINER